LDYIEQSDFDVVPEDHTEYFYWLKEWAKGNSDGCTVVRDIDVICCYQHDFCCQMGLDRRLYWKGILVPIGKVKSASLIRDCLIKSNKFLSGRAWLFWVILISPFGGNINKEWWIQFSKKKDEYGSTK
jgi:hypothetical protein